MSYRQISTKLRLQGRDPELSVRPHHRTENGSVIHHDEPNAYTDEHGMEPPVILSHDELVAAGCNIDAMLGHSIEPYENVVTFPVLDDEEDDGETSG